MIGAEAVGSAVRGEQASNTIHATARESKKKEAGQLRTACHMATRTHAHTHAHAHTVDHQKKNPAGGKCQIDLATRIVCACV